MKRIKKIIISFCLIITSFVKRVVAYMVAPPKGQTASLYGVSSAGTMRFFFEVQQKLTVLLLPIILIIGLLRKRSFEKQILITKKEDVEVIRKKVDSGFLMLIIFLILILVISLLFSYFDVCLSENENFGIVLDLEKISEPMIDEFKEFPVETCACLLFLFVILIMTFFKNTTARDRKLLSRASVLFTVLSLAILIRQRVLEDTIVFWSMNICIIEMILLTIQMHSYKNKLIDEKIKEVEHEQN